jgi:hypothetical protein
LRVPFGGQLAKDDSEQVHHQFTSLAFPVVQSPSSPALLRGASPDRPAPCSPQRARNLGRAEFLHIAVGPYDERCELMIDPVLDWSTFLGGNYVEPLRNVAVLN